MVNRAARSRRGAPRASEAVARIKLRFGARFHAPLALPHASSILRLAGGLVRPELRTVGAALNAAALALFAATVAGSALAWRPCGAAPLPFEAT